LKRRLAAVMAADMVGYSRLIAADEVGTLERHKAYRQQLVDPAIASHDGRVFKATGDGFLAEFASVLDAVHCGVEIQKAVAEREAASPADRRIQYRIGINLGDIVVDGDDILGDGVVVAARLEQLAEPGGLCISDVVYQNVKTKLRLGFDDLGRKPVKNLPDAIQVYEPVRKRVERNQSVVV
jgi:adenylate cyclase